MVRIITLLPTQLAFVETISPQDVVMQIESSRGINKTTDQTIGFIRFIPERCKARVNECVNEMRRSSPPGKYRAISSIAFLNTFRCSGEIPLEERCQEALVQTLIFEDSMAMQFIRKRVNLHDLDSLLDSLPMSEV